jgi:2-keto-4-pentenoate hydratase/2-oxohepta-3-ene-1,7-dioic acid hydratase in catechol pathway
MHAYHQNDRVVLFLVLINNWVVCATHATAFSPLAPSFPAGAASWQLNASTIILTGNISGWTDTASAARYGIIGFGTHARTHRQAPALREQDSSDNQFIWSVHEMSAAASQTGTTLGPFG